MATVGVDLGGTKTMAVLVDRGEIVSKAKKPTPRIGGPDDVVATIAATIAKADPDGRASAIGLGVPGPVRPGTGVVPAAPNLPGWDHDVDVAALLSESVGGTPVVVDNDVNVGTLAEHHLGAGKGVDDLLGVFAGTGVGAGLILDGRLRQGPRGVAGEIGHTFIAFRDLHDAEIGRGELEDYAGRNSLERRARLGHAAGEATALVELAGEGRMKSGVWGKAVKAEDPMALRLVADAASALATAMANVIGLVDVELIVLGGGFASKLGEPFRVMVESELIERSFAGTTAPVVAAKLGDVGGALGAALLVEDLD